MFQAMLHIRKMNQVKYYIKKAGGYTSCAEEKNIFIVYPNGTSIPFLLSLGPK